MAETDFYRDVAPILKTSCIGCHNKTTTEAGLNLESPESVIAGGDTGAGVIPQKSSESLVFQAARQMGDVIMPPKNNKLGAPVLTSKELAVLAAWIDEGAKTSVRQAQQIRWQPIAEAVHPVYCVAVTNDGRWGAAGRANQLAIYDLASRQLAAHLEDPSSILPNHPEVKAHTHRAPVQSIAFSPDGELLASGSYREVKIWRRSLSSPQMIASPIPETVASTLSSNGERFACLVRQGVLHVLNAADGAVLRTIPDLNTALVQVLRFSPDGSHVAAALTEKSVGIWNLETGAKLAAMEAPSEPRFLAWTPNNESIVMAGNDGVIRMWKLPSEPSAEPVPSRDFQTVASMVALETASHPDRMIAISANGQVRVWQLTDGKQLQDFKVPTPEALALSRDGKLLASGSGEGILRIWNLESGKPVIELSGDLVSQEQMAALNENLSIRQLDLSFQNGELARLKAQNKNLEEVSKKARETIETVNKSLSEKQTAAESTQAAEKELQNGLDALAAQISNAGDAPHADLEKQRKELEPKLKEASAKSVAARDALQKLQNHLKDATADLERATAGISRNEKALQSTQAELTTAESGIKQATADIAAAKTAATQKKSKPHSLAFSIDSQSVAALTENGEVRVWASASGMPIAHVLTTSTATVAHMVSPSPGVFLISREDGSRTTCETISRWTLERTLGGASTDSPFADRINALAFSPDGKQLAIGEGVPSRSGDISLWNVETGELLQRWDERHADSVLSLEFSPDGTQLASAAADKLAKITEISTGQQVRLLEGHTHYVMGVSFRADGRVLATAGADGAVLIWDLSSGERKKKIEGWNKEVTSLQYLGVTTQFVASSGDPLVRILNDEGVQIRAISNLPDFMHSAACSKSGSVIIGGGEDGIVRVWSAADGKELAAFGAQ